jgi:hypothetical protein
MLLSTTFKKNIFFVCESKLPLKELWYIVRKIRPLYWQWVILVQVKVFCKIRKITLEIYLTNYLKVEGKSGIVRFPVFSFPRGPFPRGPFSRITFPRIHMVYGGIWYTGKCNTGKWSAVKWKYGESYDYRWNKFTHITFSRKSIIKKPIKNFI